jgi:hypothetical protein
VRSGRILSEAERRFRQWAGLYSGKLFVQLVVYADESGTNDGTIVPVIAGFVDTVENWETLCTAWQTVLDDPKYRAPYFHFRELHPNERKKPHKTYSGWSDEKTDDFIHDLAILLSRTAVPVGGFANVTKFKGDPIKHAFVKLFDELTDILDTHWPGFNEPVTFFFSAQEKNKIWAAMLHEVFMECQKKDSRIFEYGFKSPKCGNGRQALQAADMMAFLARQQAEKYFTEDSAKATVQPKRILDHILMKNLRGVAHPKRQYSLADWEQQPFEKLVSQMRQHQKERKAEWAKQGLKGKIYYPELEFPWEKYGYEIVRPPN